MVTFENGPGIADHKQRALLLIFKLLSFFKKNKYKYPYLYVFATGLIQPSVRLRHHSVEHLCRGESVVVGWGGGEMGCSGRNGKGGDDGERRPSETRMLMLPVLNQEKQGEKETGSRVYDRRWGAGVRCHEASVARESNTFFRDTSIAARTTQGCATGCSCYDRRRRCCDPLAEGGRRRGGGFYAS